jgi:NADP-dependent 3-hydroxy acid dehydrogenase YdfG
MQCPGRDSIYHELEADFSGRTQGQTRLHYEVLDLYEDLRMVEIRATSSVASAVISAFARPQFNQQNKAQDIKRHVPAQEFIGQKALIVGGSRGLGALTAKILALGGAQVTITFNKGHKEALEVKEELEALGCRISLGEFDVLNRHKDLVKILPLGWEPTHLYYFATPFIFEGTKKRFSQDLFDRFCQFYVSGFWRVATQVLSLKSIKCIMYPSSSALDELPSHMLEYAAAKSAGEGVAAYIQKNFPGLKVMTPRLERLATEQTVSLFPEENKDPLPVLLEMLRKG